MGRCSVGDISVYETINKNHQYQNIPVRISSAISPLLHNVRLEVVENNATKMIGLRSPRVLSTLYYLRAYLVGDSAFPFIRKEQTVVSKVQIAERHRAPQCTSHSYASTANRKHD